MGNYIGQNLPHGIFTKQKIILQRLPSGEFQDTYTLDHRVANESSIIVVTDRMVLQPVIDYVVIKDVDSPAGSLIQKIRLNIDLQALEDADAILNNVQVHVLYLGKELLTTSVPSIDNIQDVTITSPSTGQLLVYNNGAWINSDASVVADPEILQRISNLETVTATKTYVNNKISDLIGGAPGTLDTLKELADALGEDANFSTTILGQISVLDVRVTTLESKPDPVFSLSELTDVSISSPTSGQTLKYNGSVWVNGVDNTFSGSYNDLTDKPVLSAVATSGSYNDLSNTPNLSAVATSGSYNDLIDTPAIPSTLLELSGDVTIASPIEGQILKYEGGVWTNAPAPITGLTEINGLTEQLQFISVGTSGSDVNVNSSVDTHTINIPDASATSRGLITTSAQTLSGQKTFNDTIVGSITGNSGTATKLETTRTITLSGDGTTVVSFDGSSNSVGTLTLSDTGVAAGTYTKVTADTKGRITSGTSLSASDIPSIDASKITSGQVSIDRGGTGQTTAQTAINALTQVSSATNEYVLTKDTSTGDAKWKSVTAAVFALPDGSVATPSLYFTNDTNTGLYRVSGDKIGFVANGQPALSVDGTSGVGRFAVGDIAYIGSVVSRLQIIDDNNNAASGITLGTSTGAVQLYKSANNVATLSGSLNVTGNITSPSITPTGSVLAYAGSSAPSGWLLCTGAAVSRTTYSTLFSVIGTTYGAGDGSTTFNLPDLRGRTVAGIDNMGGSDAGRLDWSNTLGTAGGAVTHTLSTNEMPSHTHTQDAHSHTTSQNYAYSQGVNPANSSGGTGGWLWHSNTNGVNSSTATNQYTGGGQAHNNMQPTILLNYIIKI